MNIEEYREKTKRTLPNLGEHLESVYETTIISKETVAIISDKLNLSHMALGLAGELGEIVNCIGTELKHKVDVPNLKEELGDIWWYFANYCNMREIPIPASDTIKLIIEPDLALDLLIVNIADLVDLVKRYIAYNKDIDRTKELDIIYNIASALKMFEQLYFIEGDDIRQRNINKLLARFPHKFTDDLAINRNLENERKTLEDGQGEQ